MIVFFAPIVAAVDDDRLAVLERRGAGELPDAVGGQELRDAVA